jgi:hypothetical protein
MVTEEVHAATMLSLVLGAQHSYEARSMLMAVFTVLRPSYIVEIGTNHGLTSGFMWSLARQIGLPSVCIQTFDIVASSLAPVIWKGIDAAKEIKFIHGDSSSMIPKVCADSVEFALIDGDHTFEGARRDWRAIESLLAERSVVFFDNMQHAGGCGVFAASLSPLWFHPEMGMVIRGLTAEEIQRIFSYYIDRNLPNWVPLLTDSSGQEVRRNLEELREISAKPLPLDSECVRTAGLCRNLSAAAGKREHLPYSTRILISARYGIGTKKEANRQRTKEILPRWLFQILSRGYQIIKRRLPGM